MTFIIAVLAFAVGFLTARLISASKAAKKPDDAEIIAARRREKEYQNFLNYDGTVQDEIL